MVGRLKICITDVYKSCTGDRIIKKVIPGTSILKDDMEIHNKFLYVNLLRNLLKFQFYNFIFFGQVVICIGPEAGSIEGDTVEIVTF